MAAAVVARWAAQLSALLIRGNAAVLRASREEAFVSPRPWVAEVAPLPHVLPEGPSSYELLCLAPCGGSDDEV